MGKRSGSLGVWLLAAGALLAGGAGCARAVGQSSSAGTGGEGGEAGSGWGGPGGPGPSAGPGGAGGQGGAGGVGGGEVGGAGGAGASGSANSSSSSGGCVPALEKCDGKDNDCNGLIDDVAEVGNTCSTGKLGVCANGTLECQGTLLTCVQTEFSSFETCDALDNDCNGSVDDGNPDGGGFCDTGMLGACADGTYYCSFGTLSCMGTVSATSEVCSDFVDNDCDGVVDDGCGGGVPQGSCAHSLCVSGTKLTSGCTTCATQICSADPYCCSTSWDSACVGEVASVCGLTCP